MSRLLPALLLLLALSAAACGTATGSPNVAATVNGVDIPMSVVEDAYAELQETSFFDQQLQTLGPVEVERVGTSGILSALIQEQLLRGAAIERDIPIPDPGEIDARLEEFALASGDDVETFVAGLAEEQGIVSAQVDAVVSATLLEERITEQIVADVVVDDADIEAAYAAQYLAQPLVVALVGEDPEAIAEVGEELVTVGGDLEDLGAFAESLFNDPSGPQLQQAPPPEQLPAELAAAYGALSPGDISAPLDAGGGLFVALHAVAAPPLDSVRDELEGQAQEQAAEADRQAAIDDVRFNADIVVNPRFGTYDALSQQVTFTDPLGALESTTTDVPPADGEGLPPFGDAPPVGEDVPPGQDQPAGQAAPSGQEPADGEGAAGAPADGDQ